VVDAEAIALGVTVGEEPTCSMRSGEKPMPGTTLAGVNGLLHVGEVVVRVLVELQHAHRDQRVVLAGATPW
jgi:hypothetical protein